MTDVRRPRRRPMTDAPTTHGPRPPMTAHDSRRPTTDDRRPTTSSTIDDRRPRPTIAHVPRPTTTMRQLRPRPRPTTRRPTTHGSWVVGVGRRSSTRSSVVGRLSWVVVVGRGSWSWDVGRGSWSWSWSWVVGTWVLGRGWWSSSVVDCRRGGRSSVVGRAWVVSCGRSPVVGRGSWVIDRRRGRRSSVVGRLS